MRCIETYVYSELCATLGLVTIINVHCTGSVETVYNQFTHVVGSVIQVITNISLWFQYGYNMCFCAITSVL